jgi:semaphorin 6
MSDIAYIESNPLMDEAVQPIFGWPVLLRTQMYGRDRFSRVAVDPQILASDNSTYDVVFVGTEDGWVIKAVNAESASRRPSSQLGSRSIVIEEIRVIEDGSPVRNLIVSGGRIVVIGDAVVKSLPLQRCHNPKIDSCW